MAPDQEQSSLLFPGVGIVRLDDLWDVLSFSGNSLYSKDLVGVWVFFPQLSVTSKCNDSSKSII